MIKKMKRSLKLWEIESRILHTEIQIKKLKREIDERTKWLFQHKTKLESLNNELNDL